MTDRPPHDADRQAQATREIYREPRVSARI
ncbi:hypothetical protein SAMN05421748_103198 [Paractinoplanes atraurantiacus]|uniref:Uncharacterized protein n=1 Tax=Paractinoplanes atraurantiacus TaxID=1036182 RepID=A0A285GZS8_9ACTN|nr:hypothetical protein SAMN05421748_103198 [Actinoplanes atraurantiacus]